MKFFSLNLSIFLFSLTLPLFAQRFDPDTVKAQTYDMGKMWTFENPPLDYFEQEYGFRPAEEWLEFVRKSALRFGNGCSASFISEDGLIMTNHHCARGLLPTIQTGEENFLRDGFFAKALDEERKIPGLFVDQLILIEDVTSEVHSDMEKGLTDDEKIKLKREKINQIEQTNKQKDSTLIYRVVALYNGGKYSLYSYKRYKDIRLVFAPDLRTAKFGGDYDNFTYPRYGLDCTFLRAYENNKPVKTKYYFKWSENGAAEEEAVFVIGNPGSTERISTIAQIEFARDIRYPLRVDMLRQLYTLQEKKVLSSNAQDYKAIADLYSIGNSLKVYQGTLNGLRDQYVFARKKAFEKEFRSAVESNPDLNKQYAGVWDEIKQLTEKAAGMAKEIYAYTINPRYSSEYFIMAKHLVDALQDNSGNIKVDSLLNSIYPEKMDQDYQKELLKIQADILVNNLGNENELVKKLFNDKLSFQAVDYLLSSSRFRAKESFMEFARLTPEEILKSDDPFIYFIVNTRDKLADLQKKNEELENKESLFNQLLGEALFKIYGDAIPPDATFTLRIADGRLRSYEYNGTIAPVYTTFFGVLDRYNGFGKKFPYNLPEIWENLPEDFDLNTKLNFICTNDIIGGNSGSPVVNKNAEIVGLVFDGNIESLTGDYIFTTETNRTIAVHSSGMIEGIRDLYKARRISDEILNGKMK